MDDSLFDWPPEWRYLVLNVLVEDGGGDFRDVGGYEDGRSVGGVDD